MLDFESNEDFFRVMTLREKPVIIAGTHPQPPSLIIKRGTGAQYQINLLRRNNDRLLRIGSFDAETVRFPGISGLQGEHPGAIGAIGIDKYFSVPCCLPGKAAQIHFTTESPEKENGICLPVDIQVEQLFADPGGSCTALLGRQEVPLLQGSDTLLFFHLLREGRPDMACEIERAECHHREAGTECLKDAFFDRFTGQCGEPHSDDLLCESYSLKCTGTVRCDTEKAVRIGSDEPKNPAVILVRQYADQEAKLLTGEIVLQIPGQRLGALGVVPAVQKKERVPP